MPIPSTPYRTIMDWLDDRGYSLSDRLWAVDEATVANLDLLLEQGIAQGRSAVALAKDLEQYLLPGRSYTRTNTPYGSDGSYYALRLARSEISSANSTATKIAAIANPFVDRVYYNLSSSHKDDPGDLCEEWADYSDSHNGYSPEDCPVPGDAHPQCMCFLTQGTVSQEDALSMMQDDPTAAQDAAVFTDDRSFGLLELAVWGLASEFLDQILNG